MYTDIDALQIKVGQSYALKVSKFSLEAGVSERVWSAHTVAELTYFLQGEGIYEVNGKEFPFQAGDLILVPVGVKHRLVSVAKKISFINIWIDPYLLEVGEKGFFERYEQLMHYVSVHNQYVLENSAADAEHIKSFVAQVFLEADEKKTAYLQNIKAYLSIIFMLIFRVFELNTLEKNESSDNRYLAIEKSMEYINENPTKHYTLSEISRLAHMSPKYYCTFFKKVNGITLWEYITGKKIDMAKELLTTTDKTIIDIAFECGFNNAANFNRAFKKYTGKTPSEYKKELK